MAELTPMMQQYMSTKKEYKDCILFYRLGDFYEMFFDDAITASRELEITLTGKNCGLDERAPMCGVPHHSVDGYLDRIANCNFGILFGVNGNSDRLFVSGNSEFANIDFHSLGG